MNRKSNYDLLRMICTIAIIALHVSASWLEAATNASVFGEIYLHGIEWSCAYNVFSRFAVPCFIMLAGAFALSVEENADFGNYYRKIFKKIYIPTFMFSLIYIVYSIALSFVSKTLGNDTNMLQPVWDAVRGVPFSHMWYLYMMLGVYLLVPMIIILKRYIPEKWYCIGSVLLLVISCIGYLTSSNYVKWDPGFSARFVGYFTLGDIIMNKSSESGYSTKKAWIYLSSGLAVLGVVTCLRVSQANRGISDSELVYKLVDPLCPLIIVASVLIFLGFSYMNIKCDISKWVQLSFYIYLIHAGIWSIMFLIIKRIGYEWNNVVVMPICMVLVFWGSVLLSKIWLWIKNIH